MDCTCSVLHDELKVRFSDGESSKLSRSNLIDLLGILERHVGSCMDVALGELDCGTPYQAEHNSTALIRQLIAALNDLEIGKKDPVFDTRNSGKNAAKSWREREEDSLYQVALQVMIEVGDYGTQKRAARVLANALNARGYRYRNKCIQQAQLINLLYRQ